MPLECNPLAVGRIRVWGRDCVRHDLDPWLKQSCSPQATQNAEISRGRPILHLLTSVPNLYV